MRTTTFLAARRCSGLTAPLVVDGPINGDVFLADVRDHLAPTLSEGDLVPLTVPNPKPAAWLPPEK